MLQGVMLSNKYWRILSSSVDDVQSLAGHQTACGSTVGDLLLHGLCLGFVLPSPLLTKLS